MDTEIETTTKRHRLSTKEARLIERREFIEEIRSWQLPPVNYETSNLKQPRVRKTATQPKVRKTATQPRVRKTATAPVIDNLTPIFAANLDRLMTLRGMRNSTLAQEVDVSREMIRQWRQGRSRPKAEREVAIARALRCAPSELFDDVDDETPAMLPIGLWAKREGIPAGRAKALFELGILAGGTGGDDSGGEVYLVPIGLHAPEDSKHVVRLARRPSWIVAFAVNFDVCMRTKGLSNQDMADATDVGQCAVTNWRSGRSNPVKQRLPIIAKTLDCTVDDLLAPPSRADILQWKFRYNREWPISMEESDSESEAA